MSEMLTMNNNYPEVIISPRDFEDLIDKYMGRDSANYYERQIETLTRQIESLRDPFDMETEEVLKKYGYQ